MSGLLLSTFGEGERLVVLHGFTGTAAAFEPLAARLPGRMLVAPALPGHGQAPRLATSGRSGFSRTLDALAATLSSAGMERVDLLGYSMGARLALAFALRFPGRVRRLVLESGSPGLRTRRQRLNRRAADERLARFVEARGVEAFAARWERLPLFAGVRALPPQEQAVLRARRVAHTAEGLAWALRALGTGVQPSQWSRLGGLLVPVLLVTGSRDLKFTRIARAMAARLPSCQNVELPGVFHVPHLEAPAAWANAVSTFLS